jgi:hypothetical protein
MYHHVVWMGDISLKLYSAIGLERLLSEFMFGKPPLAVIA